VDVVETLKEKKIIVSLGVNGRKEKTGSPHPTCQTALKTLAAHLKSTFGDQQCLCCSTGAKRGVRIMDYGQRKDSLERDGIKRDDRKLAGVGG